MVQEVDELNLFDYTYCGNYNRQIQNLSRVVPEKWSFDGADDNGILKGYLEHTFQRVYEEGKILETAESRPGQAEVVSGGILYGVLFTEIRNCQSSEAGGICQRSRGTCL